MQSIRFARLGAVLLAGLGAMCFAGPNDPPVKDAKGDKSAVSADYKIGAGDILAINVWKEPDASVGGAVVRSDGKISVPLLKDVAVDGMTTGEVEKLLSQKFAELIPGADVTVLVKESHSKKVYLMGAVKREGPLMLQSQLSILQAIGEAGGFTDYAKPKKIYVIRNIKGKQTRIPFDYEAVIKGENPAQDIILEPNDMIFVPK